MAAQDSTSSLADVTFNDYDEFIFAKGHVDECFDQLFVPSQVPESAVLCKIGTLTMIVSLKL